MGRAKVEQQRDADVASRTQPRTRHLHDVPRGNVRETRRVAVVATSLGVYHRQNECQEYLSETNGFLRSVKMWAA